MAAASVVMIWPMAKNTRPMARPRPTTRVNWRFNPIYGLSYTEDSPLDGRTFYIYNRPRSVRRGRKHEYLQGRITNPLDKLGVPTWQYITHSAFLFSQLSLLTAKLFTVTQAFLLDDGIETSWGCFLLGKVKIKSI
jgi:hypothetical protein